MKMRVAICAVATVFFGLQFGQCNAANVAVEPDNFAEGTNLSSVFSGVVLSVQGKQGVEVRATSDYWNKHYATTGQLVFAQSPSPSATVPLGWDESLGLLRADFLGAVDRVAIDLIFDDDDVAALWAFDASNNLLERFDAIGDGHGNGAGPPVVRATIFRPQGDISYVLAGGVGAEATLLDNMEVHFAAVPEPATLALVGAALAGVAATRRRRPALPT